MHSLTRQITAKVWVRPLAYTLLTTLTASGAYGHHVLAQRAVQAEASLQQTLTVLDSQRTVLDEYRTLGETRASLAAIGASTTLVDEQLAQIAALIQGAQFEEARTLTTAATTAAQQQLDAAKADLAAAEEAALKSGILSLSVTNGASAEVQVKQGDVVTVSTTTDSNGVLNQPLPVGAYTVVVSKYGFTTITTENVSITGKQTTTLPLVLATAPTPTPRASTTPKATSTPTATPAPASSSTAHSSYRRTTVVSSRGSYTADIMEFQLGAGKVKVVTDTAADYDCAADCPTMAVKSYVQRHAGAIAGINGTYFCAADYSTCGAEKGHFFWKVYNTRLGRMMNASTGLGESDPFLIFDSVGNPTFLSYWNDHTGKSFVAGINHKPAVVRNGAYSVNEGSLDDKQRTAKVSRAALGVQGSTLFVVVVQSATVMDLGAVMVALNVDNALNIDAGGSSAMYYNGEYKRGPGRGVPNALVFIEQ